MCEGNNKVICVSSSLWLFFFISRCWVCRKEMWEIHTGDGILHGALRIKRVRHGRGQRGPKGARTAEWDAWQWQIHQKVIAIIMFFCCCYCFLWSVEKPSESVAVERHAAVLALAWCDAETIIINATEMCATIHVSAHDICRVSWAVPGAV